MIESVENALQLLVTGICAVISAYKAVAFRSRTWALLLLFSGAFFLGDLYWLLFMLFYGETPYYSYIPDLSWYTSYLFLFLLLHHAGVNTKKKWSSPALWTVPVFTGGMCAFYMQYGRYLSNLTCAALMTLVMMEAIAMIQSQRNMPEGKRRCRFLCMAALFFCAMEYGVWTASCFFEGDTFANPYIWFDGLLSLSIVLFIPAVRKAVGG